MSAYSSPVNEAATEAIQARRAAFAADKVSAGAGAQMARAVLALAGGLLVGLAFQTWLGSASPAAAWVRVATWMGGSPHAQADGAPRSGAVPAAGRVEDPPRMAEAATPAPRRAAPTLAPRPLPADPPRGAPARLMAALWVNGSAQAASAGRLALPAGTRFQVNVSANRAGTLAVYAVNPEGRASDEPLWQTALQAGQGQLTPMLRLEGTRGLETLRLVLLDGEGRALAERQLQVWHL